MWLNLKKKKLQEKNGRENKKNEKDHIRIVFNSVKCLTSHIFMYVLNGIENLYISYFYVCV